MTYKTALQFAEKYKALLEPYCERIEIAGSIRRKKKDDIKDVEIVCIPRGKDLYRFADVVRSWHKIKGDPVGRYTQRLTDDRIKVDLFMCNRDNWGMIFLIRTGSADYIKIMADLWVQNGYTSAHGVLLDNRTGKKNFIREEREFYELMKIPYVEPEKREV